MASDKYHPFVNFILLFLFFLKHISISAGENCSTPTFKKDEKVVVEYFFNSEVSTRGLSADLCPLIHASKGQLSLIYRMCSGPIDKAKCLDNKLCITNRMQACYYKQYTEIYNSCPDALPTMDANLAKCVCAGAADDILASNEILRIKDGVKTFPALVSNGKYDPCFTDLSANGMKSYFCKAFKNQLPFCK